MEAVWLFLEPFSNNLGVFPIQTTSLTHLESKFPTIFLYCRLYLESYIWSFIIMDSVESLLTDLKLVWTNVESLANLLMYGSTSTIF